MIDAGLVFLAAFLGALGLEAWATIAHLLEARRRRRAQRR